MIQNKSSLRLHIHKLRTNQIRLEQQYQTHLQMPDYISKTKPDTPPHPSHHTPIAETTQPNPLSLTPQNNLPTEHLAHNQTPVGTPTHGNHLPTHTAPDISPDEELPHKRQETESQHSPDTLLTSIQKMQASNEKNHRQLNANISNIYSSTTTQVVTQLEKFRSEILTAIDTKISTFVDALVKTKVAEAFAHHAETIVQLEERIRRLETALNQSPQSRPLLQDTLYIGTVRGFPGDLSKMHNKILAGNLEVNKTDIKILGGKHNWVVIQCANPFVWEKILTGNYYQRGLWVQENLSVPEQVDKRRLIPYRKIMLRMGEKPRWKRATLEWYCQGKWHCIQASEVAEIPTDLTSEQSYQQFQQVLRQLMASKYHTASSNAPSPPHRDTLNMNDATNSTPANSDSNTNTNPTVADGPTAQAATTAVSPSPKTYADIAAQPATSQEALHPTTKLYNKPQLIAKAMAASRAKQPLIDTTTPKTTSKHAAMSKPAAKPAAKPASKPQGTPQIRATTSASAGTTGQGVTTPAPSNDLAELAAHDPCEAYARGYRAPIEPNA
jgi:hypothetical protein